MIHREFSLVVATLCLVSSTYAAVSIDKFIASELFTDETLDNCEEPIEVHGNVQVHEQVNVGGFASLNGTGNSTVEISLLLNGTEVESADLSPTDTNDTRCAGHVWRSTELYDKHGPGDYLLTLEVGDEKANATFTLVMPPFQVVSSRLEISDPDTDDVCDYQAAHRLQRTETNNTFVYMCLYTKGYTPENQFNVSFVDSDGNILVSEVGSYNTSDQAHIQLRMPVGDLVHDGEYVGKITYSDEDDAAFTQNFQFQFKDWDDQVALVLPAAATTQPPASSTSAPGESSDSSDSDSSTGSSDSSTSGPTSAPNTDGENSGASIVSLSMTVVFATLAALLV